MKSNMITVATVAVALLAVMTTNAKDKEKGLMELKLELPKPLFIGTPKNLKSPNLEPLRKKGVKRPPFFVPEGCVNVAKGKPVTSSDMMPIIGELELATDGDREGTDGSYVELGPEKQYLQIDLKEKYAIHAVVVWHYHSQARVYRDVVIQTAGDPDFILDVKTLFNNDHDNSSGLGIGKDKEWIETYEGRIIDGKGTVSRYIRLYSNGSTSDEMNHYIEVEVYGKPVE